TTSTTTQARMIATLAICDRDPRSGDAGRRWAQRISPATASPATRATAPARDGARRDPPAVTGTATAQRRRRGPDEWAARPRQTGARRARKLDRWLGLRSGARYRGRAKRGSYTP